MMTDLTTYESQQLTADAQERQRWQRDQQHYAEVDAWRTQGDVLDLDFIQTDTTERHERHDH